MCTGVQAETVQCGSEEVKVSKREGKEKERDTRSWSRRLTIPRCLHTSCRWCEEQGSNEEPNKPYLIFVL